MNTGDEAKYGVFENNFWKAKNLEPHASDQSRYNTKKK
jgi:hypothetical protein